jgi:acyl-CoA thioesterase-1
MRLALFSLFVFIFLFACSPERPEKASLTPAPTDSTTPPDPRPVILAFGDSLTAGHGVDAQSAYPSVLQKELDRLGHPYRVVNAGISGDTTSGGLSRMDAALALQPKIVILELGANDGLRGIPLNEAKRNLEEITVRFQKAGAKVILAGMTLPLNLGPDYIQAFESMYTDLARQYNTALIPFFLEGVAAKSDLNLDDGLHPNARGYKIIAETVLQSLKPWL